ncbi:hypothetical protein B9Z55_015302 [Caenorhabditis nigoni]|uniref:G-protein coupled receptors family 1 profile domain-containing protein n=1 Tax=Caenorhabditis nigoni TaxID=1611254 RepID=A0A2G5UAC5_9PELO|nr:hypothetical protein B9Z55_015302 [Caenorhabditis nigoni]
MNNVEHMKLWMFISQCQFWIILCTVLISLLLVAKAFFNLIKRKRSNYFKFLTCIIVANVITLLIILFDILNFSFKGTLVCKLQHFISNSAACFINWIWLCLFSQRFFILFYPMKRSSRGFFGFMRSGKKLVLATACFAILTQSWSLIFIEEVTMLTDDDQLIGVCERDVDIMSDFGYRILAIGEALVTYAVPFLLTIAMDIAVLYQTANSSFVVMSAENIRSENSALLHVNETVKIQSSQSIKQSNRRRHQAMRRCLMMATIQVSLNAPYYTLQLCDEIFSLRTSHTQLYLYSDAILYFIYLSQFAMIYFYTNLLVSPRGKSCRQPPKMPLSCTTSLTRTEYTSV